MIELDAVSYKYPRSDGEIIQNASAQFQTSEIVAITGKNGCGKTTLTKLMVGILRPNAGRILVDGEDTSQMDLYEIGRRVGYVFQNPSRQLFCDTVWNEVAYGLKHMEATQVQEIVSHYLELFRIAHLKDRYPGKLSQGEKQRTVLAAILSMGTQHIVLDEPTTGLDLRTRKQLGEMLLQLQQERHCGVVIVSHERDFVKQYATREWVMA